MTIVLKISSIWLNKTNESKDEFHDESRIRSFIPLGFDSKFYPFSGEIRSVRLWYVCVCACFDGGVDTLV